MEIKEDYSYQIPGSSQLDAMNTSSRPLLINNTTLTSAGDFSKVNSPT